MSTVALVTHRMRPEAARLATETAGWLMARGHQVRVPKSDAGELGLDECSFEPDRLAPGCDLALSLGGDGTILRTVELVANAGVPVLGVNIGHLGYLTEVEPAEVQSGLERFLAGDYSVEERMTLSVEVASERGTIAPGPHLGLNEAVVEKPRSGHTIHLSVDIGERFFTTYAADGMIVATPTGSTAYAFSVRGPIVSPGLQALVLTPVSPHMLFDRTLVIEPRHAVRIVVRDDRPAMLTVDGQELGLLQRGDAITCRSGPHPARFVTLGERDFYAILKAKFGLADR
ncbi:MAG: NAD(+)/NADH kinase [Acidimicrobiales bacterium]